MKRSTLKWVAIVAFINASICAVLLAPAAVSRFRSMMEVLREPRTIDDFRRDGDLYWNDVTSEKTPQEVAGRYVDRLAVPTTIAIFLHEDGTYEYDDVSTRVDAQRVHETGRWRFERVESSETCLIGLHADGAVADENEKGQWMVLEESAAGFRLRMWFDADDYAYYTRDLK
jgi:hypothetical protein